MLLISVVLTVNKVPKVFLLPYFDFDTFVCLKKKLADTIKMQSNANTPIAKYIRIMPESLKISCDAESGISVLAFDELEVVRFNSNNGSNSEVVNKRAFNGIDSDT